MEYVEMVKPEGNLNWRAETHGLDYQLLTQKKVTLVVAGV
jgi:hypothetical protein